MTQPEKPKPGTTTEERIVKAIRDENEATRRHISSVGDNHNKELSYVKTETRSMVKLVRRLLSKFGIGSDDIQ